MRPANTEHPNQRAEFDPAPKSQTPHWAHAVVVWGAVLWVGLFYAGLMTVFVHMSLVKAETWSLQETPWTKLILEHAQAVLGVPLACAAALFAVLFLARLIHRTIWPETRYILATNMYTLRRRHASSCFRWYLQGAGG